MAGFFIAQAQMRILQLVTTVRWPFRHLIQDLGRPEVGELMLEWMNPLLIIEKMDRLAGWHLVVSI